ncbi:BEM_collapsed_G0018980.mRNA.1.CDS.1 [Saccharomyces cerevisiae]|nr:BEM_collapsed_G0018980.mRNA.1.CDS.1 [Saccharomyces cerevisiae]
MELISFVFATSPTISCSKHFILITACALFVLGLLLLGLRTAMFKQVRGKTTTSRNRGVIAAKLSVAWYLAAIVMYIGKSEMWKYAFAVSLLLNSLALFL